MSFWNRFKKDYKKCIKCKKYKFGGVYDPIKNEFKCGSCYRWFYVDENVD